MTDPDDIPMAELVPGRRYEAHFSDCCVDGFFVGTFQHLDDENEAYAVFDNGRIGWGQVWFTEAKE